MSSVLSPSSVVLSAEERAIYDRQLRVWGLDAQRRLREGRVLLVGCNGLATEIAKNIVLSGVGHLTLLDEQHVQPIHLVANFAIQDQYIGKNRAEACRTRLQELNPKVDIQTQTTSILSQPLSFIHSFHVVVLCEQSLQTQLTVNEWCRQKTEPGPVAFFTAESFGLYAYFFEDLAKHRYIISNTSAAPSSNSSTTHEHSSNPPTEQTAEKSYRSLSQVLSLSGAEIIKRFGRKKHEKEAANIFFMSLILHQFLDKHGSYVGLASPDLLYDSVDQIPANELEVHQQKRAQLEQIKSDVIQKYGVAKDQLTQELVDTFCNSAGAELSPVVAVVGGLLGQEVLKVISGKDEPWTNIFIYDAKNSGAGLLKEI